MDQLRKHEIAYKIFMAKLAHKGLSLNRKELQRDLGNSAKDLGIPLEELTEFFEIVIRDLVDEMFPKKS